MTTSILSLSQPKPNFKTCPSFLWQNPRAIGFNSLSGNGPYDNAKARARAAIKALPDEEEVGGCNYNTKPLE
ncbi:hypothetical protein ACLB2K_027308 [Fragaria x ananassa]